MKRIAIIFLIVLFATTSCSNNVEKTHGESTDASKDYKEQKEPNVSEEFKEPDVSDMADDRFGAEKTGATNEMAEDITFTFVDAFGEQYSAVLNQDFPPVLYEKENFKKSENRMVYEDKKYTYKLGVDVSHHQGSIDWKKVKADGYDFAFVRIAFRGYGKEGKLVADKEAINNITNAQAAGLEVGVYVFSQAINEAEAIEEADFALKLLGEKSLELPIVYDPESILDAEARTDNVSGEQFTKNAIAFCNRIKEVGLNPAIYANMKWEAYELDLSKLPGIPIWYADYEDAPQTPYHFTYWQYSDEGTVNGISGPSDLDIMLIEK